MRSPTADDGASNASTLSDGVERQRRETVAPVFAAIEALVLCETLFPELALLDVNLRDGSKGVDVARALREQWGVP